MVKWGRGAKTHNFPDSNFFASKFLDEACDTVSSDKPKNRVFASHNIANIMQNNKMLDNKMQDNEMHLWPNIFQYILMYFTKSWLALVGCKLHQK